MIQIEITKICAAVKAGNVSHQGCRGVLHHKHDLCGAVLQLCQCEVGTPGLERCLVAFSVVLQELRIIHIRVLVFGCLQGDVPSRLHQMH